MKDFSVCSAKPAFSFHVHPPLTSHRSTMHSTADRIDYDSTIWRRDEGCVFSFPQGPPVVLVQDTVFLLPPETFLGPRVGLNDETTG